MTSRRKPARLQADRKPRPRAKVIAALKKSAEPMPQAKITAAIAARLEQSDALPGSKVPAGKRDAMRAAIRARLQGVMSAPDASSAEIVICWAVDDAARRMDLGTHGPRELRARLDGVLAGLKDVTGEINSLARELGFCEIDHHWLKLMAGDLRKHEGAIQRRLVGLSPKVGYFSVSGTWADRVADTKSRRRGRPPHVWRDRLVATIYQCFPPSTAKMTRGGAFETVVLLAVNVIEKTTENEVHELVRAALRRRPRPFVPLL